MSDTPKTERASSGETGSSGPSSGGEGSAGSGRPSGPSGSGKKRAAADERAGLLGGIEWLGNKLPDPAFLFLGGVALVMLLSALVAPSYPDGWRVRWHAQAGAGVDGFAPRLEKPALDAGGEQYVAAGGARPVRLYDRATWSVDIDEAGEPHARVLITHEVRGVLDDVGGVVRWKSSSAGADEPPRESAPPVGVLHELAEPVVLTDADGRAFDLAERGWAVFRKEPRRVIDAETGEERLELVPKREVFVGHSLLTSEGLFWCLRSMEKNFLGFAPLGVVLLGMLGIGVAERSGMIAAALKVSMRYVPNNLLTPSMVFLGIMSSVGADAGYVVLPPLAAAIYLASGRSPLAGIAAVFAGVSAGFNANLLITSLEPLISNLSQQGAQLVDPTRSVAATSSWYFMVVSTFVITGAGWLTTALIVERRLSRKSAEDGGPDLVAARAAAVDSDLGPKEGRALAVSVGVMGLMLGVILGLVMWPGAPLHGQEGVFPRWVDVIVPLMFLVAVVPGTVFGMVAGTVKDTKDVARLMIESMAAMAPIIVLAFFAGQFVAYFDETNLGRMLAFTGGEWLFEQRMAPWLLILAFIALTMVFNLFVGSMSAKYTLFAPIFVPMFMLIGIRPELTQVAYRIGDSVTNIVTPLNAYLIIILVFMQRYSPKAGIGTLIAMMLPYTLVFAAVWSVLLLVWMGLGLPLGPGDLMTAATVGEAAVTP